MKLKRFIIFLVAAIAIAGASTFSINAKTTKKSKTKTSQSSSKGYKIVNGQIIPTTKKPVIVDFYTDWCGPCKAYAPVFEKVKSKYKHKYVFIRINSEKNALCSRYYNISRIPTTIYIYPSGGYKYQIGGMNEYQLEQFIKQ